MRLRSNLLWPVAGQIKIFNGSGCLIPVDKFSFDSFNKHHLSFRSIFLSSCSQLQVILASHFRKVKVSFFNECFYPTVFPDLYDQLIPNSHLAFSFAQHVHLSIRSCYSSKWNLNLPPLYPSLVSKLGFRAVLHLIQVVFHFRSKIQK